MISRPDLFRYPCLRDALKRERIAPLWCHRFIHTVSLENVALAVIIGKPTLAQ